MDWDNLRYFLELARSGTLAGAARRTGVEHTTVARRIQSLEKQMGAPLFAREAGGHRLTEAGRQLLPAAEAMESAVLTVEQAAPAAGSGPSGLLRVGATEGFGTLILAPHLARLTQQHPNLSIDLLALPRMLHLSRREADIVISLEQPQEARFTRTFWMSMTAEAKHLAQTQAVWSLLKNTVALEKNRLCPAESV
ncbi:LysR family transcriptional regulator [Acidovorax sp. SUPP3334]|uniref:LysR family transcriptional regulator n=1 Tax=Acidovorax sp. SUPP3334 TaxID=2920881 RepID=UPI0023DE6AA5|nr:LysR family transcriptional regulator [Acidovorax sp. SUPP3334]GKT20743.1 hypothetical protein AVHM3334_02225 [Acidovorax sp. SUPP3334]